MHTKRRATRNAHSEPKGARNWAIIKINHFKTTARDRPHRNRHRGVEFMFTEIRPCRCAVCVCECVPDCGFVVCVRSFSATLAARFVLLAKVFKSQPHAHICLNKLATNMRLAPLCHWPRASCAFARPSAQSFAVVLSETV